MRALLLIDFQRDFLEDGGRMPVARDQIPPVIAAANRAIAEARKRGDCVVAIGNEFPALDRIMNFLRRNAALAGSNGARWDERVDVTGATYFPKMRGDAFSNPDLPKFLAERGVDEVALAGLMAKACVTATARGALARGLRVELIEPAIADTSDRAKARALRRLAALPGVTLVRWETARCADVPVCDAVPSMSQGVVYEPAGDREPTLQSRARAGGLN